MPAPKRIALAALVLCLASLNACMKSPSLGFENATGDEIILRASVDSWFRVADCDSEKPKGAINRQGTYTLKKGERLCMTAKARKDKLPAGELISEATVIRDARRCVTLHRDEILDAVQRSNGFNVVKITDELCPATPGETTSADDANDAPEDGTTDDEI